MGNKILAGQEADLQQKFIWYPHLRAARCF